jgi:endonuclease G
MKEFICVRFDGLLQRAAAATTLFALLTTLFLLTPLSANSSANSVKSSNNRQPADLLVSNTIVISQFKVAGVTSTADEFVELHNVGSNSIDINGYNLVYRSATGSTDLTLTNWTTSTIIPAGEYYLIAATPGYSQSVTADRTFPDNGSGRLAGAGGGLAIRNGALDTGIIVDSVGYGSASNIFVETAVTSAPAANTSKGRDAAGCTDTDNNSSDFVLISPPTPRNSGSAAALCENGPVNLSGTGAANPGSILPGNSTLLTVSVTPGTDPQSTGIAVTGNLSSIGGSSAQNFFDDGTNGDATAGDNIYSFNATVTAGTAPGSKSLVVSITDAQSRTASATISLTVTGADNPQEHLVMGNPSGATTDVNNPFNYLLLKNQYVMSYHRDRAIPNWVSWHLDSSWLGTAPRQDDFRPDDTLPAGWYRATSSDYSGTGFTRGHHTPSGDRTRSIPDNSATFLMTNMMPQSPANNNGPWERLESYSRTLVGQGNELYIIAAGVGMGGTGSNGGVTNTIANGKITVPSATWKVIIILPNGDDDVSRVNNETRTIGVIMPNTNDILADQWQEYLVTVDEVEALTGYDFFSNVPVSIQNVIESRLDGSTTSPPSIAKSFSPASINVNDVSTLTVTITNPAANTVALTDVGVTDTFPAGMEVDATPDATNSCATGIFAPTASATSISISGATIPVNTSCTFTVKIKGTTAGAKLNTTGNVTSSNGGAGATASATLTVSNSYEADVSARPNGDGSILSNDVVQIRKFLNGTDIPDQTTNEFQRADSSPFDTRGDGRIFTDDVVQARRYQNGTNPKQIASGPMTLNANRTMVDELFGGLTKTIVENALSGVNRELRVESTTASAGQTVTVNIRVDAAGDEAEYAFTLSYDQTKLSNPVFGAGNVGATAHVCYTAVAGHIRCSVGAFPDNNLNSFDPGIGEITAGTNQILIRFTFTVAANAPTGNTPLALSDINTSSDKPQLFLPTATNGVVTILAPTAAASQISGRVMTTDGRAVSRARVTLTDQNGETKSALTNPFGYYRFETVAAGETYVITVQHKRYVFVAQVINVSENINELIITAQP